VAAIAFRDVSVWRNGTRVLDDISFGVESSHVVALVGRSGAGKSTLLKLVNRLVLPDSGAVLVEGRDTRGWDPLQLRRRAGYVLQDVGLFPHMSVFENVAIVPRMERWAEEAIAQRVAQLLELVGLTGADFAGRWPDELSGGQRQRVGVARALAVDPPLLLMDEPFGALDPITRSELRGEFRRIQRTLGKTVLLVTHDMGEAFVLADKIGVVEAGRLIAYDVPAAIAASDDVTVRQLLDSVPCRP